MSCKETAIFFANLVYIPYIRQNHSTFPPIVTKINPKKVISTEVPCTRPNVSTTFFKLKMKNKFFEVTGAAKRRPMGQKLEVWV